MPENFRWVNPPSQAWAISLYLNRLLQQVYMIMLMFAPQIEADMKRGASWRDLTGNARQTLASFVFIDGDTVILVAKQHMSYGKWLELARGGKYAIVMRTLQNYYAPVMNGVRQAVR